MSDKDNQDKPSLFDQFGAPEPEPKKAEEPPQEDKSLEELGDFLQAAEPVSPAIKAAAEEETIEDTNDDFASLLSGSEEESSDAVSAEEESAMTALFSESYDAGGEEEIAEDSVEEPVETGPQPVIKAFASYDYGDDALVEDFDAAEEEPKGIQLNRQMIILIAVILIAVIWFIYQNFFVRDLSFKSKRERRRPKKIQSDMDRKKERVPLWDLSSQKGVEAVLTDELIRIAKMNAGRENPFAIPGLVVEEIKDQIEKEIDEVAPPELFKRRAHRAALVGVLTSDDRDLALINYKTATFEYLDGTKKDKIIKLATKAMNKSKDEVLELVRGDYIGPWRIAKIDAGSGLGREALITIEFDGDIRTMKVGQAMELGIFDLNDNLDIFRDAPEE